MAYNYQTICHSNLLKDLPDRHKEVVIRRFGLRGDKETLEAIGRSFGVTRERVRQIENDALNKLEEKLEFPLCQKVFQDFTGYFKQFDYLKREDLALSDLGGQKFKNHVSFLLTLGKPFQRCADSQNFYSFWNVDQNAFSMAQKAVDDFINRLEAGKQLLPLPNDIPLSYIEISKNILRNHQGLYGLKHWPEVNPRGVKDRAYLVMKQEQKPLHFTQVAKLIGKNALVQTVHNELIKDQRFVLVGRGLYALKEWGYEPGFVKEVIARVVSNSSGPIDKDTVVKEVLKQRQVQPSTILLNLQNTKYFLKNSEGKYTIRKA